VYKKSSKNFLSRPLSQKYPFLLGKKHKFLAPILYTKIETIVWLLTSISTYDKLDLQQEYNWWFIVEQQ